MLISIILKIETPPRQRQKCRYQQKHKKYQDSNVFHNASLFTEAVGKSGWIYEIFNSKLFVAKLLFEPILFSGDGAVPVEDAVVGTSKIDGEN